MFGAALPPPANPGTPIALIIASPPKASICCLFINASSPFTRTSVPFAKANILSPFRLVLHLGLPILFCHALTV